MKHKKLTRLQISFSFYNRQFTIYNLHFVVPPTGFGNYCSSVEDVFTFVCENPLN